jgi:hypothetical protein
MVGPARAYRRDGERASGWCAGRRQIGEVVRQRHAQGAIKVPPWQKVHPADMDEEESAQALKIVRVIDMMAAKFQ